MPDNIPPEVIQTLHQLSGAQDTPPGQASIVTRDAQGRIVKSKGRVEGSVNRVNRTVRETLLDVFNDLQKDPAYRLTAWAKQDLTEFYKLAGKLIPLEISGTVEHIITVERNANDAQYNGPNQSERIPPGIQAPE